jgi:hypothetical protein
MNHLIRLNGKYDEETYCGRVDRCSACLGNSDEKQRAAPRGSDGRHSGLWGIGGARAVRRARSGALNIKVADPDVFDCTNVNRQLGDCRETIGQNTLQVVVRV